MNRNPSKVLVCCLIVFSQTLFSQIVLQGVITDNGAEYLGSGSEPVANALVTLTDQADAQRTFSEYTNDQGEYSIVIWATGVDDNDTNNPGRINLLQNYPNPFNPSTVIGYELNKPANITIEIYNVLGQKIRTLLDGYQTATSGQVIWDAANDFGQGVPAGVYIYSLKSGGVSINKKMLLLDGHRGNANAVPSYYSTGPDLSGRTVINKLMSDQYLLQITGGDFETYVQQNLEITGNMTLEITVTRTVTDIDGNVYRTVKIGDQWWQAENLKVIHYRNGESIPNVTAKNNWPNTFTDAYCVYNNDANNAEGYGCLYNWYAVSDSRNIAPVGWHVPSHSEWFTLINYLGSDAGGKLKETGAAHWVISNTGATNESGFSAVAGGYRNQYTGAYEDFRLISNIWTSTEYDNNRAWRWKMTYNNSQITHDKPLMRCGFSVRLVRNN